MQSRNDAAPNLRSKFLTWVFIVSSEILKWCAISVRVAPDTRNGTISISRRVKCGGRYIFETFPPRGDLHYKLYTHEYFLLSKKQNWIACAFRKKLITLTEMPQYTQLPRLDRPMPCFFWISRLIKEKPWYRRAELSRGFVRIGASCFIESNEIIHWIKGNRKGLLVFEKRKIGYERPRIAW